MRKSDLNRVIFYSEDDMAAGYRMSKREHILKNDGEIIFEDINDIIELFNIKKFIDKELYLKKWTPNEIKNFKEKVIKFGFYSRSIYVKNK